MLELKCMDVSYASLPNKNYINGCCVVCTGIKKGTKFAQAFITFNICILSLIVLCFKLMINSSGSILEF